MTHSMTKRSSLLNFTKSWLFLGPFLFILSIFIFWAFTYQRSDFSLSLNRAVPSYETEAVLGKALFNLSDWPVFVRGLKTVTIFSDESKSATQEQLAVGAVANLLIEPPGKEWKRFHVDLLVLEVDPDRLVRFRFLADSSGKMNHLAGDLEWRIQIEPASLKDKQRGYQSRVIGSLSGVTESPRARFFGTLSERILLNQIFFFDLIKLASVSLQRELKRQNLAPAYP